MSTAPDRWLLYLLRCGDQSLYCGITTDLTGRLEAHRRGRGARYTRARGPLQLAAWWGPFSRTDALRLERRLKRLARPRKRALLTARVEGSARELHTLLDEG